MKFLMRVIIICEIGCLFLSTISFSQPNVSTNTIIFNQKYTNHDQNFVKTDSLSFYQRKSDWRQIIDDYWGSGDTSERKKQIFNTIADYIEYNFPCFNGLNMNWDSLRTHYFLQINDSTSKGRFSALMSNLTYSLKEFHVWAWDNSVVESALNPGTPVYILGNVLEVSHFGASLSVLPDSSLLVINVVPDHPLGLERGDIVLGYEDVPWKKLTFELFNAEIPKFGPLGAAESAILNALLINAGMNWHLFNSIDIIKYSTGDTLHLATESLSSLNISEIIYNNPQMPIPGIPMPDYDRNKLFGAVSYGIIENTNIGYIYLTKHNYTNVDKEFNEAVTALMRTNGLIIDIRLNLGGFQHIYSGLSKLFNFDTPTFTALGRCSKMDLYSLCPFEGTIRFDLFNDPMTIYDRPIAILTGPNTISFGDIDAYTFKFHPTTRFFGKPTNGAMSGSLELPSIEGWFVFCANHMLVNYYNPDELLVRKEFEIDENIWLETEDVVKEEDTVVKRALEWIGQMVYAYDVKPEFPYHDFRNDSLRITAKVANPENHNIKVSAIINTVNSIFVDSLPMFDDGTQGDSLAGDGLYGAYSNSIMSEDIFSVNVSTTDLDTSHYHILPRAAHFTTIGPVQLASRIHPYLDGNYYESRRRQSIALILKNEGSEATAKNITAVLSTEDMRVEIINTKTGSFGDIAAGSADSSGNYIFQYAPDYDPANTIGHPIKFYIDIYSNNVQYWSDTVDYVTGVEDIAAISFPLSFSLSQNYPNPFNPTTVFSWQLAVASQVDLSIYNILGQKVVTLVSENQPAGVYKMEWDAGGFSSGIYFYRLETNKGFIQTRKLIVLK